LHFIATRHAIAVTEALSTEGYHLSCLFCMRARANSALADS